MNGWNSPYTAEKGIFASICSIWEEESEAGNNIHIKYGQVYERKRRCRASTSVKPSLKSEFRILKRRPHHGPWNP